MKKYKHYSFDLWRTLIKPDPRYKEERASLIKKKFYETASEDTIRKVLSGCEERANIINKLVGRQVHSLEIFYSFMETMNKMWVIEKEITSESLSEMKRWCDNLFHMYPPILIDDAVSTLKQLKERDCTISILSNTAILDGEIIRTSPSVKENLAPLVDAFFFSDEIGHSKPSTVAFRKMMISVNEMRMTELLKSKLLKEDILHVGDDQSTDGEGCKRLHLDFYLVDQQKTFVKDVLNVQE
jgi:putative hydrolase of the HAD superfamily